MESIGSFCSFAPGSCVVPNHPLNMVTTHAFIYSMDKNPELDEPKFNIHDFTKKSVIGNDVWLGKNVVITNGAKIGNGVIAAAGAVITKDVPDYAVVAGVPARILRFRFTSEQIVKHNHLPINFIKTMYFTYLFFHNTINSKQRQKRGNIMKKKPSTKMLWTLFKSMFMLSACTFGGGFVIVSLMKKKFVEELGWLEEDEMLDITALTQSAPGPLPVNASVIIGYRMAGIVGSLVAILGTILPPMLIISLISVFYTQFRTNTYIAIALQVMRAGVAAVIFDVVWNLTANVCKTKRILYIGMMIVSFIAVCLFKVNAMVIILTCLTIGIIDLLISLRKHTDEIREGEDVSKC